MGVRLGQLLASGREVNLHTLDVSHNNLTELPVALGSLRHSLTRLDLSHNALGDAGALGLGHDLVKVPRV